MFSPILILATIVAAPGGEDREAIRKVIEANKTQIRGCYEKALNRNPDLAGSVRMRWTITSEGWVTDCSVQESSIKSTQVEQCIAARIRGWVFPRPSSGKSVGVAYPFVFKTPTEGDADRTPRERSEARPDANPETTEGVERHNEPHELESEPDNPEPDNPEPDNPEPACLSH